jgi:hypothetical protein
MAVELLRGGKPEFDTFAEDGMRLLGQGHILLVLGGRNDYLPFRF